MKLYEIIIKPISGFGTPLKGDTLFGHFCWQAAITLPSLMAVSTNGFPAMVKSLLQSFHPFSQNLKITANSFTLLKVQIWTISFLFPQAKGINKKEAIKQLKENKKKWMKVDESLSLNLNSAEYLTNRELVEKAHKQATEDAKRMMKGKQHQEFYL